MIYSKDTIEKFKNVATASVADAVDQVVGETGYMDSEIKPRINNKTVVGPAVTVKEILTDEELPPTHALDAIEQSEEGSVFVIGVENSDKNVAVWGGLMAAGAVVKKAAGAVLDAGVRDVSEIKDDYDFPVFSRSVSPGTTIGRYKTIDSNIPVKCGGLIVNPNDLIVADLDGVVVISKSHVDDVLKVTLEIEEREAEQTKFIKETKSLKKGLEKYNRI